MCQMQQFVYIILQGIKIAVVNSQTFKQDRNPFNSTVTGSSTAICCIQDPNLIVLAFSSGEIEILSHSQNQLNLTTNLGKRTCPVCFEMKVYFLCMEVVKNTKELWCGCNNNSIVVLHLNSLIAGDSLIVSQTFENVSGLVDTSCKVLQLKMVDKPNSVLVCALLEYGTVTCYDAVSKTFFKRVSITPTGSLHTLYM